LQVKPRFAGAPAAAWVHGGHQHETHGIGHAMVRARDRDLARLKRLAQRVGDGINGECLGSER
jgi:hypothetical protein